jgi:drug/metabolite transporter (DMT)-like permease
MSLPEPVDKARRASLLATHGALLMVQVAFAVGAVEGKLATRPNSGGGGGVEPFALAMARMLSAAVFFQLFARATGWLQPLPASEHARIAGVSLLGIVLNQTLFLVGLRLTSAFGASLLGVTIPVFTVALAIAFGLEKASVRTGVGMTLALVGVLWLAGAGSLDWGALLIAANCFSYALSIVLSKPLVSRVGPLTLVTWLFTWGALMFSPMGARSLILGVAGWGARAWVLVAVIVVVPTIVAYAANTWALGRSGPTLVAVYIYLQPLLAAGLQWVQLGEPIGMRALIAASFILVGVTLVATRRAIAPAVARPAEGAALD